MAERSALIGILVIMLIFTAVVTFFFFISYGEDLTIESDTRETWALGGYGHMEIPLEDDTERVVIVVEVESDHQFDVYLLGEEPGGADFIMRVPESVRQGLVGDGLVVEWEVSRDEFGPDGLIFILENTDAGEAPIAPEGTTYQKTVHITNYPMLIAYPLTCVLVAAIILTIIVGFYLFWLAKNEPYEFAKNPEPYGTYEGPHRP